MGHKLLDAVVVDTTGATLTLHEATGGYGHIEAGYLVTGTFGSGTVKIQVSANDSVWVDATAGITAAAQGTIKLFAPYVRATLTGATAPALTVTLFGAPVQGTRVNS